MREAIDGLSREAAAIGMQVQVRLGPRYDARAGDGLRLGDLAPWARGGMLLLSAGPAFFERFRAERASFPGPDPLDDWTRAAVARLLAPVRAAGIRAEARHPFWNEPAPLPFQLIGAAAGLAIAAPLGLTVDPAWGSWIAYRALLLFDLPLEEEDRPAFDPCAACPAPCVDACPAGAVARGGWSAQACVDHRLGRGDPCAAGCLARLACPVGAQGRYDEAALRYHQAQSLAAARRFRKTDR